MDFSVVIPVYNGGEDLRTCLEALQASTLMPGEIIVVDDGSTDSTSEVAKQHDAKVLALEEKPCGPAVARNRGAAIAQGDIIFFIDADVAVHADTLELAYKIIQSHPEIAAIFGSYDNTPAKSGLVSQYKNLQHHFVHQTGQREANTFWAGCGAVRRDVFLHMNGFDEDYLHPSIEDIEFGIRLKKSGYRIWLSPEVQVTHLKHWTFSGLLRTDIINRAIPWTQLILSSDKLPSDLNLNIKSRLSVIAIWFSLAFLITGFLFPLAWVGTVAGISLLIYLNYGFYRLIISRKGLLTGIGAFFLHSLYYIYSSSIFGFLWVGHLVKKSFNFVFQLINKYLSI